MMGTQRVKFTFMTQLVKEPIIYRLGQEFNLVTNIRRADVRDDFRQEKLGRHDFVLVLQLKKQKEGAGERLRRGRHLSTIHEVFAERPVLPGLFRCLASTRAVAS